MLNAGPLLHAEVRGSQVDVNVGCMSQRGHITGAVPCGAHAELLCKDLQLAGGSDAAHLGDVHTDVVDQALGDEGAVLVGVVEQLAFRMGMEEAFLIWRMYSTCSRETGSSRKVRW